MNDFEKGYFMAYSEIKNIIYRDLIHGKCNGKQNINNSMILCFCLSLIDQMDKKLLGDNK